jgi:hypothetical protein
MVQQVLNGRLAADSFKEAEGWVWLTHGIVHLFAQVSAQQFVELGR